MLAIESAWRRVRARFRKPILQPAQEIVYRELFIRELNKFGLSDEYYPVGAAANHSLLYLVARCFAEFEVHDVLEFGVGQSSILLDRLRARCRPSARIVGIEHDGIWADRIRTLVASDIQLVPLGRAGSGFYDMPATAIRKYGLVIVDGPPAIGPGAKYARLGFLDQVPDLLADDFIIIVDDAERSGEDHLARAIRKKLRTRGIRFREGNVISNKIQATFNGGKFEGAAFL